MDSNIKFIIISGAKDPREMLKGMMRLLEASDLFHDALRDATQEAEDFSKESDKCEDEAPDFTDFGGALAELADTAEEYRDKLDSFISEADRLLEALGDLEARWNTTDYYAHEE